MRIYVAGMYKNKAQLQEVGNRLSLDGHLITSSWLKESHAPNIQLSDLSDEWLADIALKDIQEVASSDAMVFFSESDQTPTYRNGRMVEFGIAQLMNIPIHVVGPRENIFFYTSNVSIYDTVDEMIRALAGGI